MPSQACPLEDTDGHRKRQTQGSWEKNSREMNIETVVDLWVVRKHSNSHTRVAVL